MTAEPASKDAVEAFLSSAEFDNYQSIALPHGLATPGQDRSASAVGVLAHSPSGKSVLDVGCKYGYFCHQALEQGASRVKGVDIEENNVAVSRKIAELWGRGIEFEQGDLIGLPDDDVFDMVLFLNVIHHIVDPILAMEKLAGITRELMVLEVPTLLDDHTRISRVSKLLLRTFFSRTPLAFIGSEPYHRVWYFSQPALQNLLVEQMKLFSRIDYAPSKRKAGRLLAYCWK